MAWQIANFTRAKHVPSLQSVLDRVRLGRDGPQSGVQAGAVLREIAEKYGLKIRKGKRRGR